MQLRIVFSVSDETGNAREGRRADGISLGEMYRRGGSPRRRPGDLETATAEVTYKSILLHVFFSSTYEEPVVRIYSNCMNIADRSYCTFGAFEISPLRV